MPITGRDAAHLLEHGQVDGPRALGILVGDGALDPADPAPVPEWAGTEKESITVLDLLEMRSGLQFVEDYVDGEASDVHRHAVRRRRRRPRRLRRRAAALHPPGHGVELLVGHDEHPLPDPRRRRRPADEAGRREAAMRAFLDQRLFGPVGMADADPRFDDAGTWVGSSYVHAPARQFARFGELYLRDGVVGDGRVLPEGGSTTPARRSPTDPETGFGYGRHWWIWPDQPGSLAAHGYEGQYVVVLPEHDAVVVHLGKTDAAVRDRLVGPPPPIIATL